LQKKEKTKKMKRKKDAEFRKRKRRCIQTTYMKRGGDLGKPHFYTLYKPRRRGYLEGNSGRKKK